MTEIIRLPQPAIRIIFCFAGDQYASTITLIGQELVKRGFEVRQNPDPQLADFRWAQEAGGKSVVLYFMTCESTKENYVSSANRLVLALENKIPILPILMEPCQPPILVSEQDPLDWQAVLPDPNDPGYVESFSRLVRRIEEASDFRMVLSQHRARSRRVHVFISYPHGQFQETAQRVAYDLREHGCEVFFDKESLAGGDLWWSKIQAHLHSLVQPGVRGCVVYLITARSAAWDGFCIKEIKYALNLGVEVIPVLLEAGVERPEDVLGLQYIDMRAIDPVEEHLDEYHLSFDEVVKAVEKVRPRGALMIDRITSTIQGKFHDRVEIREQLIKELNERHNKFITLVGPAGIGKSGILANLCQEIDHDASSTGIEVLHAVNCQTLAKYPLSLLSETIPTMINAGRRTPVFDSKQYLGELESNDLEIYLSHLFKHLKDRDYLLILDNFEQLLDNHHVLSSPKLMTFFEHHLSTIANRLQILAASWFEPAIPIPYSNVKKVDVGPLSEFFWMNILQEKAGNALGRIRDEDIMKILKTLNGSPFFIGKFGESLKKADRDDRENLLGVLEDLKEEESVKELLKRYHKLLRPQQRKIMQVLSLFSIPVRKSAIYYLLGETKDNRSLNHDIRLLKDSQAIEYSEDYDPEKVTYFLLPIIQNHNLKSISREKRTELHRRGAKYFELMLREREFEIEGETESDDRVVDESQSAYLQWYKIEKISYQHTISEFLNQLASADDPDTACLSIAKVYFDCFWWWADYIEYDFTQSLLHRLDETEAVDPKERSLLKLLKEFDRHWPLVREYKTRHRKQNSWMRVLESIVSIRSLLKVDGTLAEIEKDPDRLHVRAVTDIVLGEAGHFLRTPDYIDSYQEAEAIARQMARDGYDDLEWSIPWIEYHMADFLRDDGRSEEALPVAGDAWVSAQMESSLDDHEIRANIMRLFGDLYWQSDPERAWKAYQGAIFCAYRYQGEPEETDEYTRAFFQEISERILDRIMDDFSANNERAIQFCLQMHEFWRIYWQKTGYEETADRSSLQAWLADRNSAKLHRYLIPYVPEVGDKLYAEIEKEVSTGMLGRAEQFYQQVVQ
jgi:hypothetical protein